MILYAIYDAATGAVVGHSEAEEAPTLPEGYAALPLPPGTTIDPATMIVEDGVLVEGSRPPDLETARAAKINEARLYLAQQLAASCETSQGVVQCDPASQALLTSMVVEARDDTETGVPWSIRWRRTDNSWTDILDAETFVAFAKEVAAHVKPLRAACWAAIDACKAATTVAQIAAVNITAGYPAA